MNTRFQEYISGARSRTYPILPMTHITTCYEFVEMMPYDKVSPFFCKNFEEELIYLFYGRPAYKSHDSINLYLTTFYPVVLVFKSEAIKDIKRIFPFDTGAFFKGYYSEFISRKSNISNFALPGNIESALDIVARFYTSNQKYISGQADQNIPPIDPLAFDVEGVQALLRLPGTFLSKEIRPRDERSTSIEIQVGSSISIKDCIQAIILPEVIFEVSEVVEALQRWDAKLIKTYHPISSEMDFTSGQLYQIIYEIYRDLKIEV